ncbi:hypothetical protein DPMN_095104 [Dreissena polymorpha]|uniref:Uncharacterized protein n=1 Tax=Dreissena polymorpha TaxID=45954 RepID=A0A9D4L5V7_DREPO|nr:hypothetical protein DPMN_095104 [Dreissena polymorpha]
MRRPCFNKNSVLQLAPLPAFESLKRPVDQRTSDPREITIQSNTKCTSQKCRCSFRQHQLY